MRLPRLLLFLALVSALVTHGVRATPFEDRVELLFRPILAEQMALSPDGQRLAYTVPAGKDLTVVIMTLDGTMPNVTLVVGEASTLLFSQEQRPADLRFLRWATPTRLVFSLADETSPIMAVDGDGKNPAALIDANEFTYDSTLLDPVAPDGDQAVSVPGAQARDVFDLPKSRWITPRLRIVGFLPGDPEHLVIESDKPFSLSPKIVRRNIPPDQYALNIHTGKYEPRAERDRLAREYRAAPAEMYRELQPKFPDRVVTIVDWTEDLSRVVVKVTGGTDPGRVFVFRRAENLLAEVLRCAPWLHSADLNATHRFAMETADHARLTGSAIWPRHPKLNPPPLLVLLPAGFPANRQPKFDPEAQVMADLGFVVLRLDHRGAVAVRDEDFEPLREHLDRLSVDDAVAAIHRFEADNPGKAFDHQRIAVLGHGFGGYLVVRAMELYPDLFRCGIAFDAPFDLPRWLFPNYYIPRDSGFAVGGGSGGPRDIPSALWQPTSPQLAEFSAIAHARDLAGALFLLAQPGRNDVVDESNASLRSKLKGFGHPADYLDLDPGFNLGTPKARVAAYKKIEEFFNLRLYDYGVKVGPAKEVK